MRKIKGFLLRDKPYTVSSTGEDSLKVVLSRMTRLNPGEKVYEELLPDGCILLIPEKIFKSD